MRMLELARPLWISSPEWPPISPSTVRVKVSPAKGSRFTGRVHTARVEPAQLTVSTFSSSESMLIMYFALRSEASSARAPIMPTSSSTVNRHSSGPWAISSASRIARPIATAMPSSPPRVVPRAPTSSPSTNRSRLSVSMSLAQSGSFSQTMSIWPCSITVGAFS